MLRLMKSNVPLLNVLYKNLHKAKIYVNDMILTTFSPFDVKYKKLNWKSLCLGGWDFHIFPRLHWIMEGGEGSGGECPIPFRVFVGYVTGPLYPALQCIDKFTLKYSIRHLHVQSRGLTKLNGWGIT